MWFYYLSESRFSDSEDLVIKLWGFIKPWKLDSKHCRIRVFRKREEHRKYTLVCGLGLLSEFSTTLTKHFIINIFFSFFFFPLSQCFFVCQSFRSGSATKTNRLLGVYYEICHGMMSVLGIFAVNFHPLCIRFVALFPSNKVKAIGFTSMELTKTARCSHATLPRVSHTWTFWCLGPWTLG